LDYVNVHVSLRSDYRETDRADRLWRLLENVARALDEFRADAELALMSSSGFTAAHAVR
jgi:hypothetical protein